MNTACEILHNEINIILVDCNSILIEDYDHDRQVHTNI